MSTQQGKCPECSTGNPFENLICWRCGAKLPWADAVTVQAQRQALQTHEQQPHRWTGLLAFSLWTVIIVSSAYILYQGSSVVSGSAPFTNRITTTVKSITTSVVASSGTEQQTSRAATPPEITPLMKDTAKVAGTRAASSPDVRRQRRITKNLVSRNEYDQIQTGMTLKACVRLIGAAGVPLAGSEPSAASRTKDGYSSASYMWQNSDGSNMVAEFEGGRLVAKAQAGL